MKSVLISIKPKWCELIASGSKTIEVRKTRPKIDTPFKCYIYATKLGINDEWSYCENINGRVIGEFVCDNIVDIFVAISNPQKIKKPYEIPCTGLTDIEVMNYLGNGIKGYGWHISNLKIYDKPKCLGDFKHTGVNYHFDPPVTRPPQSWCYVEEV